MSWFRCKKPCPQIKTPIGVFAFSGNSWMCRSANGQSLVIAYCGEVFDMSIVEPTARLLEEVSELTQIAIQYLRRAAPEVIRDDGMSELESIGIDGIQNGIFGLTFAAANNADLTITVEFKDKTPQSYWLAD